jgi:hypothetical protein
MMTIREVSRVGVLRIFKTITTSIETLWKSRGKCWHTARRSLVYNNNNNINSKGANAGQLNRFTHLTALLVLHDRGVFCPGN